MAKLDIERESKKPKVDVTIQVIIAAQKWTTGVESLALRLGDPVVCITDHVESCIYSGIKPKVSCLMKEKKVKKLVGKFALLCCKDGLLPTFTVPVLVPPKLISSTYLTKNHYILIILFINANKCFKIQ